MRPPQQSLASFDGPPKLKLKSIPISEVIVAMSTNPSNSQLTRLKDGAYFLFFQSNNKYAKSITSTAILKIKALEKINGKKKLLLTTSGTARVTAIQRNMVLSKNFSREWDIFILVLDKFQLTD